MAMHARVRSVLAIVALAGGSLGAAACGGDDGDSAAATPAAADGAASPESDTGSGSGNPEDLTDVEQAAQDAIMGSDGDRMFDADNDMISEAIVTATGAHSATWSGSTLTVTYNDGSVAKGQYAACFPIETLLGDDDSAVVVYPDGAIDCSAE
jgi:hypothetical protein